MMKIKPEDIERELVRTKIALVSLWAAWCRPCKAIEPHLAAIAEEYADRGVKVFRMNADENSEFLVRTGVFALPTVLFYREGKLVGRLAGTHSLSTFVKMVTELLL